MHNDPVFRTSVICILLLIIQGCATNNSEVKSFEKNGYTYNTKPDIPENNSRPQPNSTDGNVIQNKNTDISNDTNKIHLPDIGNDDDFIQLGKNTIFKEKSKDFHINKQAKGEISLNFMESDLREFLKSILGNILELNYTIDPEVKGTVTLETKQPIRKQDLLPIVEQVLSENGAVLFQQDDFIKVVNRSSAAKSPTAMSRDQSKTGYTTRIMPLDNISASDMKGILEQFVSKETNISLNTVNNLLLASGSSADLDRLQETINLFDINYMKGMSVGLFSLEHTNSETLKSELDSIFNINSDQPLVSGLRRIIAIERLNSLLVISNTRNGLFEAEDWLNRLDKPGERVGKNLYVYYLENAKATELADILGRIFSGKDIDDDIPAASVAPGTSAVETSPNQDSQSATNAGDTQSSENVSLDLSQLTGTGSNDGMSLDKNNSIQVIADDVRNALIVMATPSDYEMVDNTINKLDIIPLQVLIEASIIEVTLNDNLNYGVEWFFKNSVGDKQGQGLLDTGEAGLAALSPSFSYTIIDNASNISFALNALESESSLNVLSSPTLMVLDNQTARINVGDEIPVPSRQSTSNINPDAPTVNEIEYRKTGVTLSVKPRVNSSGLVTMEISQEVSNAIQTTTSDINAPTIQQREINSVVAINSGETIVLGGLIQDSDDRSEAGVPGLHKIPVLGNLFGLTTDTSKRTELLVLLTPRVVRNKIQARAIRDEFKDKLHSLPNFSDHNYNPENVETE